MAKTLMVGLVALSLIAAPAWAADAKDPGIAPGTVINAHNWQQYKDFMPMGLQRILQGDTAFRLPQGWEMDVGPTVYYPLPKRYWDLTEKYKGQAQLVTLPTGGYTIRGYHAGAPFPDYSGPLAGYKIFYNVYYQYRGDVAYFLGFGPEIDRYMHTTTITGINVPMVFTHNIEPGFGHEKEMPGYYASFYDELLTPEQSKYTTELELVFDNPNTIAETYVFLPSLRRSLRLSGGARCSPFLGTDYTGDDTFTVPLPAGWFNVKFQGRKKVLMFRPTPKNRAQFDPDNYYTPFWFPKPAVGKWQVLDALVIDVTRVPGLQNGYCYGLRRLYVDPRTWTSLYFDLFDSSMKFWKTQAFFESPYPLPDGGYIVNQQGVNWIIDFQNQHATVAVEGKDVFAANQEVPRQYQDASRYGSPGGLAKIMQ